MTRKRKQHEQSDSLSFMGIHSSVGEQTVGHYRIEGQVGHGGMGQVYRAQDLILDRIVALKFLPPWRMGNAGFRERLRQEAKRASALNHPNIVTIHEFGVYKSVEFIVMEFVDGKTLAELVPDKGLAVELSMHYALQIADALATAHSRAILHRDLKPRNIMVTGEGRVKLLDFGLATVFTSSSTPPDESRATQQFGSKIYMAPEQLNDADGKADPRSEIFSFGLIFHEMLHGGHPFGPGTREEILDGILHRDPPILPPSVPDAIVTIIIRCLRKSLDGRFGSASDLLTALQGWHSAKREPAARRQRVRRTGSSELTQVRRLLANVTYNNAAQSRNALDDLMNLLDSGVAASVKDTVVLALKKMVLTVDLSANCLTTPIRLVRRKILDVLKISSNGNLTKCFGTDELAHLDLYGMDFSSAELHGRSFQNCFLVEASFRCSRLERASFSGAYVRNVDFAEADLSQVDLTDADWFNALNLREEQLMRARRSTLLACPASAQGMHQYIKARYGFPFESWSSKVQMELEMTWKEYLRPGGLRDVMAGSSKKEPNRYRNM